MEPIYKEDVPILNAILRVAIKMKTPYYGEFEKIKKDFPELNKLKFPHEYEYYLNILQSYKVANVNFAKDTFQIGTTEITERFLENSNGFEQTYKEISDKESQEKKLLNLNIRSLEKSMFQIKYWWIILIINAIVSFLITYLTNILTK